MTEIVVRFTVPNEHTETMPPIIASLIEQLGPALSQIDGTVEVLVDGETVEDVEL